MPRAFILAKIEAGKDKVALEKAKKLTGVVAATHTYGIYDLHIEVKFGSMEELDEFIFEGMRKIDGIRETVTLVVPLRGGEE